MFVFHFIAIDQVEKKLSTMRNLVAVLALLASLAAGKFFRIHSLSLFSIFSYLISKVLLFFEKFQNE